MSFDTDQPDQTGHRDHPAPAATPTLARLAFHALNAARFAFSVVGAATTAAMPMQRAAVAGCGDDGIPSVPGVWHSFVLPR